MSWEGRFERGGEGAPRGGRIGGEFKSFRVGGACLPREEQEADRRGGQRERVKEKEGTEED